mgnify:CR=1 FL=1
MATTFHRALETAFIDKLAALAGSAADGKGNWWSDVLADEKLLIGVRGGYLNVYWRGQSIFRVSPSAAGLSVSTHEKYLLDPSLEAQVPMIDGAFDLRHLLERGFIGKYEGPETLKKLKASSGVYAGTEKKGCHEIAVRNSNLIDVEIAFPGVTALDDEGPERIAPRIDFAAIQADGDGAKLAFWEAKDFSNPELRAREPGIPKVIRQIEVYKHYLHENAAAVEDSYRRMAANLLALKAMGWARPLSPVIEDVASGKRRLSVGTEPKVGLVIFGFDMAQRDGGGWKGHHARLKDSIPDIVYAGDPKYIKLPV